MLCWCPYQLVDDVGDGLVLFHVISASMHAQKDITQVLRNREYLLPMYIPNVCC